MIATPPKGWPANPNRTLRSPLTKYLSNLTPTPLEVLGIRYKGLETLE